MSRCLLHKTKLGQFKDWLTARSIEHRPGRGAYQILQVALPGNQWAVVYDRDVAPEHYTVTGPLEATVRRFLRETRQKAKEPTK